MAEGTYNQFCPIAMASEVLCTRWTLLLVRELLWVPNGLMSCGVECRECRLPYCRSV